jgi:hypothetical protein
MSLRVAGALDIGARGKAFAELIRRQACKEVFEVLTRVSGIRITLDEKDVTRHARNDMFYFNYHRSTACRKASKGRRHARGNDCVPLEEKRLPNEDDEGEPSAQVRISP